MKQDSEHRSRPRGSFANDPVPPPPGRKPKALRRQSHGRRPLAGGYCWGSGSWAVLESGSGGLTKSAMCGEDVTTRSRRRVVLGAIEVSQVKVLAAAEPAVGGFLPSCALRVR